MCRLLFLLACVFVTCHSGPTLQNQVTSVSFDLASMVLKNTDSFIQKTADKLGQYGQSAREQIAYILPKLKQFTMDVEDPMPIVEEVKTSVSAIKTNLEQAQASCDLSFAQTFELDTLIFSLGTVEKTLQVLIPRL